LEVTRERASALRLGVKNLKVRHQGRVLGATVSAGVASYPEHGLTWENLLQAADAALYQAKEEGRDRVISA
jgi:diguanylate cyclase (GGDEF)-like protein